MIFNFYNNDNDIQELYIQNPILGILEIILKNIVKDNSIRVNRNQNFIYYFTLCNEHLDAYTLGSIMSIFPQCDRMVINAKMFSLKKENDNYFIYYSDPKFIEKLQKIVKDFLKME